MAEALTLCLAALFSLTGMGWLALSLEVHWRQIFGRKAVLTASAANWLRLAGWIGLLLAAICCFIADRPSMAVLVWVMLLAGAATTIALLLAWRAHWLRVLVLRFGV
ncbi:MAG: DUF3325 domain-containing protein [Betaproteobacteria bacterium]|jgi:purine-cytosine permease-like protein|nr:DUF3325 domain-containing protein [Betaproteobacteria bacterium]MBK8320459.1 DUF3325 domain-containing protein [Betaproteobacteria bacterium]MBK9784035.1 DUF3325 domain-containing protein [Candidatus Dechloromonas phosphorivorans]